MMNTTINATNLDYRTGTREPAADANRAVRRASAFDRESLAAFAIYLGLSLLFFGRGLIGHFGDRYIGVGPDAAQPMYSLTWWPFALAHHLNPFLNNVAWFPETVNLAHSPGCIPLPSILMAPITMLGGPILSSNLLMLLSPATSAWAGFILFRRICGGFWPASAGGYVFGFSPFILGHLLGDPAMIAGWFIPLATYTVLLRLDGEISAIRFAVLTALVLIGQAGWSLELLATASLFGSIALALAAWTGGAYLRRRIFGLAAPLVCAYAATAIIASPYLLYFFRLPPIDIPSQVAILNSTDPLNLILPTRINALGGWTGRILAPRTNLFDSTAYIGLPALFVVGAVAVRRWSEISVRLFFWMSIIIILLALGPFLVIGLHVIAPAPEILLYAGVPLLRGALPCRFDAYVLLCVGGLIAIFLSARSWSPALRAILAALIIVSLAPNLNSTFWITEANTPAFFQDGVFKKYLSRDEVILIIPYGNVGVSDLWQAQTNFYFRKAGSYLGITPPVPASYVKWPIVPAFYGLFTLPELDRQVASFLRAKGVTKVIVPTNGAHVLQWVYDDGPASFVNRPFTTDEREVIRKFFSPLDPNPIRVAGVTIYRIAPESLAGYAKFTVDELQLASAKGRVEALVVAANTYLSRNLDPKALDLAEAARLGLIPRLWLAGPLSAGYPPEPGVKNGLMLKPAKGGAITVGLWGSRPALEELRREYGPYCLRSRLGESWPTANVAEWNLWVLTLDFDREGLAKAAAYAKRQEAGEDAEARGASINRN
jgi:hypothetical protein